MRKLAIAAVVATLALTTTAHADPGVRFGLTFGIDRNMPEAKQYGPLVGVVEHAGRFSAEANYSFLSFMDPDTVIHRVGVGLRANLWERHLYFPGTCYLCTHGPTIEKRAIYAGLGVARRFGHWRATDLAMDETTRQDEANASVGFQMGPWDLGVRLSVSRRDPELYTACRSASGTSCPAIGYDPPGAAGGAMLEWTWIYGR